MPSIRPSLLGGGLEVEVVHEKELRQHHIDTFLDTVTDDNIGLAPIYGTSASLSSLAFASTTHVLHIRFSARSEAKLTKPRKLLQDALLCDIGLTKYAFLMDKLTLTLYHCFKIRVAGAFSLCPSQPADYFAPEALVKCLDGVAGSPSKESLVKLFTAHEGKETNQEDAYRQAWLALHGGSSPSRVQPLRKCDSSDMSELVRLCCTSPNCELTPPSLNSIWGKSASITASPCSSGS